MEESGENILVVDDEPACGSLVAEILADRGFVCTVEEEPVRALESMRTHRYALVFSDVMMPQMDGIQFLEHMLGIDADVAVVMITAYGSVDTAVTALRMGATDYITKPFSPEELVNSADRALGKRRAALDEKKRHAELEAAVAQRTAEVEKALAEVRAAYAQTKMAHLDTIFVLAKAAETNDEDTGRHIKRVGMYSASIARELDLGAQYVEQIGYSSEMHDIGKVAVHPDILKKPGVLTEDEFAQMRQHTLKGEEIMTGVEFLQMAREIAVAHHEKFDGTGYPHRLAGHDIPQSARVVAIADVFDALTSKRCYRDALPLEDALGKLSAGRGTQFDPEVYDAFLQIMDDVLIIREAYNDDQQ